MAKEHDIDQSWLPTDEGLHRRLERYVTEATPLCVPIHERAEILHCAVHPAKGVTFSGGCP